MFGKQRPPTMKNDFIIYGANGHSGSLIARHAVKLGLKPILAGRDSSKIRILANELKLDFCVIDLNNRDKLINLIKDYPVILNAAGPFYYTAQPIIDACLQSQTHYLDLSGEYYTFESLAKRNQEFLDRQIMVLPGIGLDVLPSDCLAVNLAKEIKNPHKLTIAIFSNGSLSKGTLKSGFQVLASGLVSRKNNVLTEISHQDKIIFFDKEGIHCSPATLADVVTAYYSTGIENIETYFAQTKKSGLIKWLMQFFPNFFKSKIINTCSQFIINQFTAPPLEKNQHEKYCEIYMMIENQTGDKVSAKLKTIEGYLFTAFSSINIIQKVLDGNYKTGFQTPATAYGPDLVFEIPGTDLINMWHAAIT